MALGHIAWDMGKYDFLLEEAKDFDGIHPSLQRQAILNMNYGLYEVIPAVIKKISRSNSILCHLSFVIRYSAVRCLIQAIEKLYADRLAEQYEVLAYHFAQGEEWAKALEYFCKAAKKAAQTFATRETVALYDQAFEAADDLGEDEEYQTLIASTRQR